MWKFPLCQFLLLLTLVNLALPFRQRLVFYDSPTDEDQGNSFVFETHVPNNTFARSGKAVRVCIYGLWTFFKSPNYESRNYVINTPGTCQNQTELNNWTSFRYAGASDTKSLVLSLYPQTGYNGQEISVDGVAYGGITAPIRSFAFTGTASWMLYEGNQFNGTSACAEPRNTSTGISSWNDVQYSFNLTSVGSVIRDCRARRVDEIHAIREQWESSVNS